MDQNTQSFGSLIVNVTTADGIVPIEGASVAVSISDGGDLTPYSNLTTDSSGRTEKITIPTPPRAASQTPDGTDGTKPYSTIVIEASKSGFYSNRYVNALVFPDILTIQNVHMIPVSGDVLPGTDTIYFESENDELL